MQFLKTLFWVVVAVAAAVFAMRNWTPVTVALSSGLLVEAKLPVLIYGAFLVGLVPALLWANASRWRLRRRIEAHERTIAELRAPVVVPHDATVVEPPAQS